MELGSGGLCTTLLRNQMALESLDGCRSLMSLDGLF